MRGPDVAGAAAAVAGSPLFGVTLTLLAYRLALALWRRAHQHPLLNPVLVAIALVVGVLLACRVSYAEYLRGGQYISFLLGPATVALAVPLHRQAEHVRRSAGPILACTVAGAGAGILTAVWVTRALGGSEALARSMAPKSATTPVAIVLAQAAGGLPSLTAVLTILTGVLGAVAAGPLLTVLGVREASVRGFAIGLSSHGIGTARAFHESVTTGAFAGLAMAVNALATALLLPVLLRLT